MLTSIQSLVVVYVVVIDHFITLTVGMYEPGSTITLQKVAELTKCMKLISIIKQVSVYCHFVFYYVL